MKDATIVVGLTVLTLSLWCAPSTFREAGWVVTAPELEGALEGLQRAMQGESSS